MKISIIVWVISCLYLAPMRAGEPQQPPTPRVVSLDSPDKTVLQLLSGPPETVTMRSGRVILAHGKSVGKHSTGQNEEVLVILEGRGEMRIAGKEALQLDENVVAYCPPHTEHDVFNTGAGVLRYVYIVARAQ